MESVFPTVRNGGIFNTSSLDLQFARTKTLDSRVTFTRASSGTYVGSDGLIKIATTNEARFDHNPTTGESLGLLVEEQRTNLALRSEEFDNASWVKSNSTVTANTAASPSGSTTADSLVENSTSQQHYAVQNPSISANIIHTATIYVKPNTRSSIRFGFLNSALSNGAFAHFNASTGVISSQTTAGTATNVSYAMDAAGSGWYRCRVTCTVDNSSTTGAFFVGLVDGTNNATYTGDGTSGIYIWGAQLEAGVFPTSYIPTTSATVTRSADVASITGANFSSWYRQDEGTVFAETRQLGDVLGFAFAVSDGTDNNRIAQFRNTTTLSSRNVRSGTAANPGNITIASSQALVKSVIASIAGNSGAAANGVAATDSAPVAMPTVDRLQIALGAPGSTPINGTIRRLTYWPARLPNNVLQEITR
jgi:hypothetical protein